MRAHDSVEASEWCAKWHTAVNLRKSECFISLSRACSAAKRIFVVSGPRLLATIRLIRYETLSPTET